MKDQTRNIETFKVGASRINKFDFQKHQGEMREHHGAQNEPIRGKVETDGERVARLMRQAHEKVLRRKKR